MVTIVNRPKSKGADPAVVAAHLEATSHVVEQYNNFDVVWAKMGGFPWWPGVLFHSWEAVDAAQFQLKERPVIPAPEKRDGGVVIYHCLVVFLDQFNCATLEISPATLCAFETNYARLSTEKKALKAKGFKTALQRAERMLHMSDHLTEAELAVLSAPPPRQLEKRRRVEPGAEFVEIDMVDDEIFEPEDEDMDDEYAQEVTPSRRKPPSKASKRVSAPTKRGSTKSRKPARSPRYFRGDESIETPDDEFDAHETDEDYVERVPKTAKSKRQPKAAAKATVVRKKASRKETSGSVVEISDGDDSFDDVTFSIAKSESKQKVKRTPMPRAKAKSKSTFKHEAMEDSDFDEHVTIKSKKSTSRSKSSSKGSSAKREECSAEQANTATDQSKPPVKNTPLASIWTTREGFVESDTPSDSKGDLAYKLDLLWDSELFTAESKSSDDFDVVRITKEGKEDEGGGVGAATGRGERGATKRQMRSVQQSQIRQSLLQGNLDPHTMVQCEAYAPRDISLKKERAVVEDPSGSSAAIVPSGRTRGVTAPNQAPFDIQVHPDAVFVCDLHAHLATCEIIGFLGGRWDETSRTLYIQAAFPCRSLVIDGDDGSTDVEMDPESEIELREIIQNAKLEVVGWYHSHPAFAPDPSIRDIENQTSYQQLFQRTSTIGSTNDSVKTEATPSVWEPFVGLIVGTYDTRRDSPISLFRYFHVRGERVSSAVRREVFMPYELVPSRPQYRSVLEDERRTMLRSLSMYPTVYKSFFGDSVFKMKTPSWPLDTVQTKSEDMAHSISPKNPPASRKRKIRAGSIHDASDGATETTPVKKTKGGRKRPGPRKGARNAGRKGSISADTIETEMIDLSADADCEMEKVDVIDVASESSQNQTVIEIESSQSQELNSSQCSIESSTRSQPTLVVVNTKRKNGDSKERTSSSDSQIVRDIILATVGSEGTREESIDSRRGKKRNPPRRVSIDERAAPQPSNSKTSLRCQTKNLEPVIDEVIMVSSSSSQSDTSGFVASSQSQTDSFVQSSPHTHDDDPFAGIFVIDADSTNGFGIDAVSGNSVPQSVASTNAVKGDGDDDKETNLTQSSEGTMIDDMKANDDSLIGESLDSQSTSQDIEEVGREHKMKNEDEDSTVIEKVEEEEESPIGKRSEKSEAVVCVPTSRPLHDSSIDKASRTAKRSSPTSQVGGTPRRSPKHASETSDEGSSDKAADIRDDESIVSVASSGDGASQSTGRKRHRKPTSTSRVNADQRVSIGGSQTGKSPRSPHSTQDDCFSGFNTHELSVRGKSDESKYMAAVPVETSTQSLLDWGGVEVIDNDFVDFSTHKVDSSNSTPENSKSDHVKHEDVEKAKKMQTTSPSDSASFDQSNLPRSPPDVKVESPHTDGSLAATSDPVKCVSSVKCTGSSDDKNLQELCSEDIGKSDEPTPTPKEVCRDATEDVNMETTESCDVEMEVDETPHSDPEASSLPSAAMEDNCEPSEQMGVQSSEEVDVQMEVATVVHDLVEEVEKIQSAIWVKLTENIVQSDTPQQRNSVTANSSESPAARAGTAPGPEDVKMEFVASTPPSQEVTESATEIKSEASNHAENDAVQASNLPPLQLFGANQACEDFRTSMQRIAHRFERVKEDRDRIGEDKPTSMPSVLPNGSNTSAVANESTPCQKDKQYLESLRTRYGSGINGCAEQVITLVDYYRDFERRTDLNEMWKPRITKLQKMEASLRANVRFVNVPVDLRDAFVDDLIGYIRTTWGLAERRR